MGRLTTHVLDTASGKPGRGIAIALFAVSGNERRLLKQIETNEDGRCDAPLLEGEALQQGTYELVFHIGAYLAAQGGALAQPPFLDQVPLRFGVADADAHYHVPLLFTAWSYSTYRGS